MSAEPRVLIVEDEADAAEFLRVLLERCGHAVQVSASGSDARRVLSEFRPQVALMDVRLPDVSGLGLLKEFRALQPGCQVLMVTGYGNIPMAVEAMRQGAFGFLEKPIDPTALLGQVASAAQVAEGDGAAAGQAGEAFNATAAAARPSGRRAPEPLAFSGMVAAGGKMRQVFALIERVAPTDASVLIHGEHGTGKELVARALHERSRRARGAFITVNCAAIPPDLIESELFGHRKGAFTGAISDKPGLMQIVHGGTLFLDEIGEMAPTLQARLLRVLQEREFRQVGGSTTVKTDFRLLCATNVNLKTALESGKLREDLFFRINTVTLTVPPLRERTDDVPVLVECFIRKYAERHGHAVERCDPDALHLLLRHPWPGNVRELEHVIERAVVVATGPTIEAKDLPAGLNDESAFAAAEADVDRVPPHHSLEELERLAIVQTLTRTRGNKRAAAGILGLNPATLYSKLRKYKLTGQFGIETRRPKTTAAK